jgi:hypothetical protein
MVDCAAVGESGPLILIFAAQPTRGRYNSGYSTGEIGRAAVTTSDEELAHFQEDGAAIEKQAKDDGNWLIRQFNRRPQTQKFARYQRPRLVTVAQSATA